MNESIIKDIINNNIDDNIHIPTYKLKNNSNTNRNENRNKITRDRIESIKLKTNNMIEGKINNTINKLDNEYNRENINNLENIN